MNIFFFFFLTFQGQSSERILFLFFEKHLFFLFCQAFSTFLVLDMCAYDRWYMCILPLNCVHTTVDTCAHYFSGEMTTGCQVWHCLKAKIKKCLDHTDILLHSVHSSFVLHILLSVRLIVIYSVREKPPSERVFSQESIFWSVRMIEVF